MPAIFGTHDEATLRQLDDVAQRAEHTAIMADGHLGYIMPIGGVAAYRNKVSVAGVGFDIACGNAAIRTNLTVDQLLGLSREEIVANPHRAASSPTLNAFADEIAARISFGIGRKNADDTAPIDHPLFTHDAWWLLPNTGAARAFRDDLRFKARAQLGTVGSGNHYVDVFVDESGVVWVGVHFGSRGFGHTIASGFMALAAGKTWGDRVNETEALLSLDTQLGQDYWALMNLAGTYAYAGREWVARRVVTILGGEEVDLVHNHHNFAWLEEHDIGDGAGFEDLVVVRKGATPAFPGQRGFIGGSMGDDAVIVEGSRISQVPNMDAVDKLQRAALYSTVHGAGRVMSRTEAAGVRHRNGPKMGQLKMQPDGTPKRAGKITEEAMRTWVNARGVVLRGAGLDEAPQAYRRLPDVLEAQGNTVTVVHTLRPLIVVMAGANEHDPYKD